MMPHLAGPPKNPLLGGGSSSFLRLKRHMARKLRQNDHHTGDMRFRVNKKHSETDKRQRGDHYFRLHKELPSEHPQFTIRRKWQIVSIDLPFVLDGNKRT